MKQNFFKIMAVAILLLIVAVGCNKELVTGVTLDKSNIVLTVDETATLIAIVSPKNAKNKAVSWTSSDPVVATVVNGKITAKKVGTATIIVITDDGNYTAECTVEVAVMINGVKWATRNVGKPGTFAATPEDAGMFYQWNSKTGWSTTDPMVNHELGITWDNSIPEGVRWEKVNNPCPPGWRVPAIGELKSLVDAGSEWEPDSVTGRTFGSGNNTIFLPAAGYRYFHDGMLDYVGSSGNYWSGTSTIGDNRLAHRLGFYSGDAGTNYDSYRSYGFSVRCVAE